MSVKISYLKKTSLKSSGNLILFCKDRFKIDGLKKHLSKNDFYATFDWSFSTLINGCRGSTGPTIQKVLSDSSIVSTYNENFSGMYNKGYTGISSDVSSVDWSMDISNTSMIDANDWFKVRNQRLEAQDINGTAIWYSPLVDISSYNMVSLDLDAEESVINYLQNTNFEGHWEMDENMLQHFQEIGLVDEDDSEDYISRI